MRTVFMVAGSKFGSDDGKGGFPHEQQALKSPTKIYALSVASDDVGAERVPFSGKLWQFQSTCGTVPTECSRRNLTLFTFFAARDFLTGKRAW